MLEVLLFAFLAIAVGLTLTFAGYAAFRLILPILAFLAGLWLGMDLVTNFAMDFPFLGFSFGLILGLVFGAVFAFIAYAVYALAIILAGGALGYLFGAGLMQVLGLDGFMAFLVGIICAGGLAYFFAKGDMPKVYMMVITAGAGASALIGGVLALFGQIPPSQLGLAFVEPYVAGSFFWVMVWAVLVGLGIAVQYQSVKASYAMVPKEYSYDETVKVYNAKAKKG